MSHFEMPVQLFMSSPVATLSENASLADVERRMFEDRISCVGLLSAKGELSGVLSRTDLLRVGRRQAGGRADAALLTLPNRTADEVMTKDVLTVTPDTHMSEAAKIMVDRRVHRLFVRAEDGQLLGLLSVYDIVRAVAEKRINRPISSVMTTTVFTIRATEPVGMATDRLQDAQITGLLVVDEDWPVGVFTQEEALHAQDMDRSTPVEEVMSPAMLCLNVNTPAYRAAAQVTSMEVRRVIAVEDREFKGLLTGLDFAKLALKH